MREAPALAGVVRDRPRAARPPQRRAGWRPFDRFRGSLIGRAFARPGVTICGAVFAALMVAIVVNAIFFQSGHRPATVFGSLHAVPDVAPAPAVAKTVAAAPAASVSPPANVPVAQTTVAPAQPAPPVAAPGNTAVARSKPTATAVPHAKPTQPHASHADSIARLLGKLPAPPHPDAKVAEATSRAKPKATKPKFAPTSQQN